MKRLLWILGMAAMLTALAGDGFAQQGDRAVRVQGRQTAGDEQRVALVIGNHAYTRIASLRNPGNDARDMAAALRKTGFRVTLLLNATRGQMGEAIAEFEDAVSKGGVGLFFYAGHGVQVGGVNYLIPLGANITRQSQVEFEAISANRVLASMEAAGNRLNMVFLDACRNNPFKGNRFRAIGGGLAAVRNAPKGSLISYATGAGGVAADGTGRNGTYTKNLLRYIGQPGLELTTMMKRVRSGVQRDTRDKQTPYELSSLTGDFYFTKASIGSSAPVTANVPKGPGKSSFSLGDLNKAAQSQQASRRAWAAKLGEMKDARRQAAIRRDTGSRTWRDPVTGMEFVKVPGGSFEMGCHANAGKCDSDERPTRTVRLDGFWLGKHEVTQGQWKRIMGSNPSRFKKGDNYPVEQVSWNDVQQFIRRLNSRSSAKFSLPSEAQWEYACRAGGKAVTFGTGNGRVSSGNANYKNNNGGTTPVGRYPANALGLHDMSGNLWEWVQDKKTSYGNVGNDNPIYERSGALRVLRGGGWRNGPRYLRCSYRVRVTPSSRDFYLGFRLLRSR
ncbi:MAG: SUMF1/EgtB/PvdO family nonheme iron enzyme [SAR324 cluster bacterium]|nr:SUMF1/EgtB/PvdO family nonheme iron enzyme [SAR324 cluster bacterium]